MTAVATKPATTSEVLKSLVDPIVAEVGELKKSIEALKAPVVNAEKALAATARDAKKEYRAGFKSLSHQLDVVRRAAGNNITQDERTLLGNVPKAMREYYVEKGFDDAMIEKATGMSESVGPDGGFLLAPTFAEGILEITHEFDNLLDRCDKYEMQGTSLKFRAVDETSLASTRRGGVLGYWVDEGGTITASKPKFRNIDLIPHKVTALTYMTEELLQDGPVAERYTSQYAAEELVFQVNDKIVNGTGAGCPLGILNAGCTVSVSKETGQAGATIVTENAVKMYARLHAPSRKRAVWLTNQDTFSQIFTMTLGVGTGGIVTFMSGDQGMTKTPSKQMLGIPILEIPWCPTLGTVGDLILADMSQFIAGTRGSVMASNSIHVAFVTDETAFKWTWRVAGMPWWNAALTPYRGTATQSPFVTLATRS